MDPTSDTASTTTEDTTSKVKVMDGHTQTQIDFMNKDMVILLDYQDNIVGKASKLDTHLIENISDRKLLHRAFSVFLFDSDNRLLLQQRAHSKITFPLYWTNTCCSHPLYISTEMDGVDGVKKAAVRKLDQELGISPNDISPSDFTFMTRIHYYAGSDPKWGEHEIDYILIAKKNIPHKGNPEEVENTRWVSQTELKKLFIDSETDFELLITPWFRLIVENFIYKWWDNLDTISTFANDQKIHKLN